MKILFIVPGSGDSFYCGNCFRDNLQATALRKAGHEVIIMPLYLPLRHRTFQADTPLFFPATTFYAAQKLFPGRHMPNWLKRLTASEGLLNMASSLSGSTSAEGMEQMTLAMITGEDTAFQDMVKQLIDWVKERERPDVIHLSSSLLIAIAKEIKQAVDLPIVCSLQDEEVWLDGLKANYAAEAWQGIVANSRYVDALLTTSHFYQSLITERLPQLKAVKVIYPGVERAKYRCDSYPEQPTIGFFYRMNEANGLDILVDAFVLLKQQGTIPGLRLRIGGGFTATDKPFLKQMRQRLAPYATDVVIEESYKMEEHARFYQQISLLSVPLRFEEGVGLYLCEAFAAGRPVVEPATGSFPEIVGEAGVLYSPNEPTELAAALAQLLTDPQRMAQCRTEALHLSESRYSEVALAQQLEQLYLSLTNKESN